MRQWHRSTFVTRMDQTRTYRFLLLEDDDSDVFLMRRQLERHLEHVELLIAKTQEDFEAMVQTGEPDVILSDYRLPRYSGIEALLFAREHNPLAPFIFVTGALHNEELAADTILQGASGFVLKNNLEKLWKLLPELLERNGTPVREATGGEAEPSTSSSAPESAPEEVSEVHVGRDAAPAPSELAQKLSEADPETLAKIQRLLSGASE